MPDQAEIAAAAARIAPYIRRTPVLRLAPGDFVEGVPVILKLEFLQHAGSFKPRGAFNRALKAERPAAGLIAASGGNHGAAVAFAARRLGLPAEIYVPAATPAAKVARIAAYGARVVQTGATYQDALEACRIRQAETGALDIHAYDHEDVLAGQGTVGLELEEDAPEATHILVASGGGGLVGGIAAWYRGRARVIGVEPESCPCLHDALAAGRPVPAPVGGLAADSLGARQLGAATWPIARDFLAASLLVPDAAIRAAQLFLWDRLRIAAEPGGATALAALLSGRFTPPPGARPAIILCGANLDPASLAVGANP